VCIAATLLTEPHERLEVEPGAVERETAVVDGLLARGGKARERGPTGLDVLSDLEIEGAPQPALMVVERRGGQADHLIDVEELTPPGELAVPGALPGDVVDPQLKLGR